MNQDCITVDWDDEALYIQEGPIASPPVMDVYSLVVMEGGELPAGIYYYAVTAVGINGESAPFNILKVRAPHKEGNTIMVNWFPVNHIIEYKVYRGTSEQNFDGFIPFYGKNESMLTFVDTGDIVLQDSRFNPPTVTPLASPVYSIKKENILKIDYAYTKAEGSGVAAWLYVSTNDSVTAIDLYKVLNQPSWNPRNQRGVRKAVADLEKWFNNGRRTKEVS